MSQWNASLRPKPPATAPWSTMQSAPATTRPKERPARIRNIRVRSSAAAERRTTASAIAPPTTSRISAKSSPRANLKSASIVPGVLAPKTCLHEPAFAFLTLKTKAPATGCESAEITRHVTV